MAKTIVNNNIKLKSGGGVINDATDGLSVDTAVISVDINKEIFQVIASDTLKASADTQRAETGVNYVKKKEIQFKGFYSGVIRVKFSLCGGGAGTLGYGRIYVNGVAVGTERSINSTCAVFSEDITVNQDDLVQLYIKSQTNGMSASCSNFRLYYDFLNVANQADIVATD